MVWAEPELRSDFLTPFPFLFFNQGIQYGALREFSSSLSLSVSIDEVTSEGPASSSQPKRDEGFPFPAISSPFVSTRTAAPAAASPRA